MNGSKIDRKIDLIRDALNHSNLKKYLIPDVSLLDIKVVNGGAIRLSIAGYLILSFLPRNKVSEKENTKKIFEWCFQYLRDLSRFGDFVDELYKTMLIVVEVIEHDVKTSRLLRTIKLMQHFSLLTKELSNRYESTYIDIHMHEIIVNNYRVVLDFRSQKQSGVRSFFRLEHIQYDPRSEELELNKLPNELFRTIDNMLLSQMFSTEYNKKAKPILKKRYSLYRELAERYPFSVDVIQERSVSFEHQPYKNEHLNEFDVCRFMYGWTYENDTNIFFSDDYDSMVKHAKLLNSEATL